jgi:aminotransferase
MYTSNYGLLELREEIVRDLYKNYKTVYDPRKEVLVTVGVSEAIDLAFRAILEPGDEVIVPEPCYVSYNPCVIMAGGVPVNVTTKAEEEFRVRGKEIEALITPKTKAIFLCYPNNPTGGTMTQEVALEIAEVARKYDLLVLSDEVYAHLTYEGEHVCFAALPGMAERTLLLNGFSKAYAMTGWRLGYAAGPTRR